MRTIFLTGGNGQVGWELQRTLSTLGRVIAPSSTEFDLSRPGTLSSSIRSIKPDLIVNAAAHTAVDKAESESELAYTINAASVEVLAHEAARSGVTLVHFSTDYVFDGSKTSAYTEADQTRPLSVYGYSKLAGEQAVEQSGADHLIFRTSWVYGARGRNFLLTMLRLARERDTLSVVADQTGAPTWSRSIAEAAAQALALWLSPGASQEDRRRLSGVYHMTCSGKTTWHGFAEAILEEMQTRGERVPTLNAITTAEYPAPAKRPNNSLLSNERLLAAFGLQLPGWQQALRLCLAENRQS